MSNIILDSEFVGGFPFLCKDFSSRVILSTIYEPLFNKVNGEYNSYYIKKHSLRDRYLELVFFNDLRWSNGDYLTSTDVYNTLLYLIRNKTIFSCYLDFISGVSDYLYNDGDESLIDIINVESENKLLLGLNRNADYLDIFSNIEFSPVYFVDGRPDFYICNGLFRVISICDYRVKMIRNDYYKRDDLDILSINFVVNKNLYYPIYLFHQERIDVTSSTYFPNELVCKESPIVQDSSIIIILEISKRLLPFKKHLLSVRQFIGDNFSNIISVYKDYFFRENFCFGETLDEVKDFICNSKINIAYPDYYPNDIVIGFVCHLLRELNIDYDVHKFNILDFNCIDNNDFDIIFSLKSLLSEDDYDLSLFYMNSFSDSDKEKYVDFINSVCVYGNKLLYDEFLDIYSRYIPLGKLRHVYLKSKVCNDFYINDKGLYRF